MNKLAALLLALALTLLGGAQAAPAQCCMECDAAVLCAAPGCASCVSPSLPTSTAPPPRPAAAEAPSGESLSPQDLLRFEIWKPPRAHRR